MSSRSGFVRREREPYLPGNTAAVKSGAWSARTVDPVALELIEGVLERRPDLAAHPEALMAWGRCEARAVVLSDWFARVGFFDDDGKERAGLRYLSQFERAAADARARLGLDPASEAQLVNAQAEAARQVVDMDAIRARGRAALEAGRRKR